MRFPALLTALAAGIFLTACDEKKSCTETEAMAKFSELGVKFQSLLFTNPARAETIAGQMEELMMRPISGDDYSEICHAADKMLKDLG